MLEFFKRRSKVVIGGAAVALLVLMFAPLPGCAYKYSAESIEGRVVDKDTGQPLEGVIVVADWMLEFGWEGGFGAVLYLTEAVTDKQGRYFIPAWGPKEIPAKLPSEARLKNNDPALTFYRNGYEFHVAMNSRSVKEQGSKGPAIRTSEWNQKTIELRRFTGTPKEYSQRVLDLWKTAAFLRPSEMVDCEWKRVPTLIRTFKKEHGIELVTDYSRPGQLSPYPPDKNPCAREGDFVKEVLK